MKVTCVVEFNVPDEWEKPEITTEKLLDDCLCHQVPPAVAFRIMETTVAPYGPQHPGGVYLKET